MFKWFKRNTEEKLNPAQETMHMQEPEATSRENIVNYRTQYESLEIVNRGVNMLVDDAAEIPFDIGEKLKIDNQAPGMRKDKLFKLLNVQPNPFQDINAFKRNLFIDLVIDGNAFIYYDGVYLYHLPANKIVIHSDSKTFISHYEFEGKITYYPNEIIHVKENSFYSIYRGISRLKPALRSMRLLTSMREFQNNFFKNGAVPGLVLKSKDTLSDKIKERMLASWRLRYNPTSGGRRPMILDGGLEIDPISNTNFKELDFQTAVHDVEETILKAIGVPPILFSGGNNANIAPNIRLYYLEAVLPLVRKFNHAFSRYFGYEVWDNLVDIEALQRDLKEQASYYSTLVNGGVISANEARVDLGKEPKEGHDDLRIPANIAGSASNPSEGGRPSEGDKE